MEDTANNCFVCDAELDGVTDQSKMVTLQAKAISRLRSASLQRKDMKYVKLKNVDSIKAHKSCYTTYIRDSSIQTAKQNSRKNIDALTTDTVENFDFSGNCFLCGDCADSAYIKKNKQYGPAFKKVKFVSKIETQNNIQRIAKNNNACNDMKAIQERIENINLLEKNARYHNHCMVRFYKYEARSDVKGRPISEATIDIIEFISNYILENADECQYSLKELIEKYQSLKKNDDKPDIHNLKERLKTFFGEEMHIYKSKNDYNLIFLDSIDDTLAKYRALNNKCQNEAQEEERIVTLAAYIILKKIRSMNYDIKHYPAPSKFLDKLDEQTPPLLHKLLNILICTNKAPTPDNMEIWNHRVTMYSHAIVASVRPRSFISPLLLGISTLMHKKHASRTLIDSLSHLGVAESYSETLRFEDRISCHPEKLKFDNSYIQMVFDNADHNTNTIDGRNTFHATGGIICVTPASSVSTSNVAIDRFQDKKSPVNGKFGFTPVHPFIKPNNCGLKKKVLEKINTSKESFLIDVTFEDFVWSYNKSIYPEKCAGWSGYMEKCVQEKPFEVSKVIPIPFINAPITQYDTIYSVLREANARCIANKQDHIFVTFDLPPYQKATEVLACVEGTPLEATVSCVILRLGSLHITMSYLGSIGYIMDGSGINEAFGQVYAENSVDKALGGHAYSRAVRGHILVQNALNKIIIDLMELKPQEIAIMEKLIQSVGTGEFHEVAEKTEYRTVYNRFKEQMNILEEYGPTSKLWILYIRMVEILKVFIEAERCGNWNMHLYAGRLMLPYLHAAGHLAYAKYLQLYLQNMSELQEKMTNIFELEKFTQLGYFTIRRTNKFRSGIASDMTIEQMLMRPMKCTGGLTHGRGMSESVLSRWILSTISTLNIVDLMEKYCHVQYQTSEQHKDTSVARISRDASDMIKLSNFFSSHNPFPKTDNIMSITSGVIGNEKINCYKAFEEGFKAIDKMQGNFGEIKMERKNKVVSLKAATSSIKMGDDIIPVDSNLIYQRMLINVKGEDDKKNYMTYELAPFPPSIFKNGLMRKSKKAAMFDFFDECTTVPIDNIIYVIDGGLLLHKVVWQNDKTIGAITQTYVDYVEKFKGKKIIVFDGYAESLSSTKEYERMRRQNMNSCCEIKVDCSTKLTVSQDRFLSNGKNKEQLINLLCSHFENNNIETIVAKEDADTEIVKTALLQKKENTNNNVIIMGEDVDLLILLTHFSDECYPIYYLKPSRGNIPQKLFSSDSFKYPALKGLILFSHAFSGCDTTSAFHNKGKKSIIQLLEKNVPLRKLVKTFYNDKATVSTITENGCEVVRQLYSTKKNKDNLVELRYKKFESAKIKTSLKLESLPPTEAAAKQHCLRVYHQVQKWLGHEKEATEWGWSLSSGVLKPNFSDQPLIPDELLLQVTCKCRTGCKTKSCSCRKNGVRCTQLCTNCDADCTNIDHVIVNENTFSLEPDNAIDTFVEDLKHTDSAESIEEESDVEDDVDDNLVDESEYESDFSESESILMTKSAPERKRRVSTESVDEQQSTSKKKKA